jgi:hypothetical protein
MFADSSELLLLIPFAMVLLVLIARLDIYFTIRQNRRADARYLAEISRTR